MDEDGSYNGYGKATEGLDQDIDFDLDQLEGDGRYGLYNSNSGFVDSPTGLPSNLSGQGGPSDHMSSSGERFTLSGLQGISVGGNNLNPAIVGENAPVCRRPFSSLSVCDSDDDDHMGSMKSAQGERQKLSQRYSAGYTGGEGRYKRHHTAGSNSNSTHSVLSKRKRGNKTASAELSALSPLFEIPTPGFRQHQQLLQLQKKSVGFGLGGSIYGNQTDPGHYTMNNGDGRIHSSDLSFHSHNSNSLTIHLRSPLSSDVMNDCKTVVSGNSSLGSLTEATSHHKAAKPSSSEDRVEDGYDGASETGRCETDGGDEFGSENDNESIIDKEFASAETENNTWAQAMDIQLSGLEQLQ